MTGWIIVKRLCKSGIYVSELDTDKSFVDANNPNGFFKAMIEPIDGEIKYCKVDNGIMVSGEMYLFGGYSESCIDEKIKSYKRRHKAKCLKQTEVSDATKLW